MKKLIVGLLGWLALSSALAEPVAGTLTFTVTQAPGANGTIIPSLTWETDPNANGCVASGDWTGTRAADRPSPLVLAAVTPPKTYTLTCSWSDTDVVLTWVAPTKNEDGSPVTNLAGYKILYGNDPANLGSVVNVPDPASTSYTLKNLAAGVYHFAMTASNSAGAESKRSPTVSATLGAANKALSRSLQATIPQAPSSLVATP